MARDDETVVCGLHAVTATLKHRPDAIRRVFYAKSIRHELGPLLKHTASLRRPYNEVDPDELEKIAGTVHHEGVVVVADPVPFVPLDALLAALPRDGFLLALDGVGNPHNVGAILRSAAWFGAAGLIIPEKDPRQATLSPAAVRVARGGAEVVPCAAVPTLAVAVKPLRAAGVTLVAAEAGSGDSPLEGAPLPRPCCVVLGSEDRGIAPAVRVACDRRVSIPGTSAVESLNVSVAAGVILAGIARGGLGTTPQVRVEAPADGRARGRQERAPRGGHRGRRKG